MGVLQGNIVARAKDGGGLEISVDGGVTWSPATPSSAPLRTQLSGNNTQIALTGLNGDVDIEYRFRFYLLNAAGSANIITIGLTGLGGILSSHTVYFAQSGAPSVGETGSATTILVDNPSVAGQLVQGFGHIYAKSGGRRFLSIDLISDSGIIGKHTNGWCTDTASNLTGVTINGGTAPGFQAGSWAEVVPLGR